MGSDLAYRSD